TAPPVVPGFAANIASRLTGAKLIYHCMDLHPEIGKLSGEFSNPTVYRALERIDIATCRRASRIIVLSEDMRKAIGKRDASLVSKVSVINNFSLPSEDKLSNSKSDWFEVKSKDKLRLFFAGNIGRFQGLELFVEAIHELVQSGNTHVELVFMGEGAALPEITKLANSGPAKDLIHFVSHQPISIAKRAMQAADFGIVCLTPEIIRYAYPSKTLTYLEQGCPIFSVVEQDSELAKMVETRQIGVSSPINDKAALVYRLTELANNREKCLTFSENAKATYKELFEIETCLEKWSHELKEL
ncbi:glycosyltransferase family 4 protein, partial [Oleiphilus sp. HI0123]